MNQKKSILFLSCVLAAATVDFVGTMVESRLLTQPAAETALYLIGYGLFVVMLAGGIREVCRCKTAVFSTSVAFLSMLLRFVFDILTYIEDGPQLDGVFSMTLFLFLDAAILLLTAVYMRRKTPALRWLLCAVTAVYTAGEMLGYPISQFTDWDEFFLMLGVFAVFTQRWDKCDAAQMQ